MKLPFIVLGIALCVVFIFGITNSARAQGSLVPEPEQPQPLQPPQSSPAEAPLISAEAARELLAAGKDAIMLDVRGHDEYVGNHIPGAVLFPVGEINQESAAKIIGTDMERPIIVYCASGFRSKTASGLLLSLGYKNVWNLGPISNWPFGTEQGEPASSN
ncbi:MAG TPA: rhodanese-like domain-containing protein [Spirochaetales bacterium]|nr:rhodanese-like domain-containing protein [Spirochaetales bacterium]